LKQFSDLGLSETVLQAVTAEGYTTPTPIQIEVIPAMLAGRDILGTAQTGTGKTAAFVLPLLNKLVRGRERPAQKCCGTLILAPTRELAAQIADSIRTYGQFGRQTVAVVVGGVKPGPQIKAMARGVDILVATPGRLLDHMSSGVIRLDQTTTVILDEADQMLDLGFMPAIRKIMGKVARERQTALLSATMPKQIRALANDFLKDPAEISVAPEARPIELIEQKVMLVDRSAKRRLLEEILGAKDVERAIVFTRTKRGADKVQRALSDAGLSAAAIHGNKSQNQRTKTLDDFKRGNVIILVATDIAARGIDVDGVSHVVNYEMPNIPESYVHRIGRTARAGKTGIAISLCDGAEREYLRDIEKLVGYSLKATGNGGADDRPEPRSGGRNSNRQPREGAARNSRPGNRPARNNRHNSKPGGQPQRTERKPGVDAADDGLARMLGEKRRPQKNSNGPSDGPSRPPRRRNRNKNSASHRTVAA
jgi:ATP-dependent RNA helicase RhlE